MRGEDLSPEQLNRQTGLGLPFALNMRGRPGCNRMVALIGGG